MDQLIATLVKPNGETFILIFTDDTHKDVYDVMEEWISNRLINFDDDDFYRLSTTMGKA